MKKIFLYLTFFLLWTVPTAAAAKSVIDVFTDRSRDLDKIKIILALPVIISADAPDSEHFFTETLAQTWNEITEREQAVRGFVVKTAEQVVAFEKQFSGGADLKETEIVPLAAKLAPDHADAVMTLTITEAFHGLISHGEQVHWSPGIGIGGGYWHGGWRPRGGVSIQRQTVPAYDEFYASGALKIEIRDAKDGKGTLLYGISARDTERSGMLPGNPSLTRLMDGLVRAAAAELSKIK